MHLKVLLGDYPVTAALKSGVVRSDRVALDFADVAVPNTAFKRVVRDLEFDVAELAIVTFLMAKARGVPLSLLPAVVVARFQHGLLVHDAGRRRLSPRDLEGRRVGLRSWTVTTAAWIRAILADEHGVDFARVRWVVFEDAHVAGFTDPPYVERAKPGQDLLGMLRAGEIDAAIVGAAPEDANIVPVIADPAAEVRDWQRKHGALQLNHLVTVKTALLEQQPDIVREVYRMLADSKRAAGLRKAGAPKSVATKAGDIDLTPFGIEANRRNLDVAIDMVHRQGLIPRRCTVDELFAPAAHLFA